MSKIKFPQMENVNQFRQVLLASLNKLSDQSTIKSATEEVYQLLKEHTINNERLNVVIYHITEFHDTMKTFQRREHIKLLGVAAEIYQDKLIQYMPKILAFYNKRIKDSDQILHPVIAETMGTLTHQLLRNTEDTQVIQDQIAQILKQVYFSMLQSNKIQQLCASQLEKDIQQQVPQFMQHIITCMENTEFSTRKMAIDTILTLAKVHPMCLKPYRKEVNNILNELRFDKIKPVRDSSLDVLNLFKEIPELYYSEEERLREEEIKEQQKLQKQQKQQEIKKDLVKRNPRVIPNVDQDTTVTINGVVFSGVEGGGQTLKQKGKQLKDKDQNDQQDKYQLGSPTSEGQNSKKVSTATQKRREAKTNKKHKNFTQSSGEDSQREKREHESIFKRNSINQEFLQSAGKAQNKRGGIEIFAPDGAVEEEFEEDDEQVELQNNDSDLNNLNDGDEESIDKIKQDKTPGADGGDQSNRGFAKNNNLKVSARDYNSNQLKEEGFPQMTTIQHGDNDDDNVLLTEDQRQHFLVSTNRRTDNEKYQNLLGNNRPSLQNSQIIELEEEHRDYQNSGQSDRRRYEDDGDSQQNQSFREAGYSSRRPQIKPYGQQQINDDSSQSNTQRGDRQSQHPQILSQNQQQSLKYVLMEIQKISQQQARMMDGMQTFQNFARNELAGLRQRVHVMDQKVTSVYYMKNGRYPHLNNSQMHNAAPPGYGVQQSMNMQMYDSIVNVPQRVSNFEGGNQQQLSGRGRPNQNFRDQRSPERQPYQNQSSMRLTQNFSQQTDWSTIQQLLSNNQVSEAYQLAISNSDDDLLLIKLMGKTGICLQQLLDDQQQSQSKNRRGQQQQPVLSNLVEILIQKIIAILTTKEFVNVLLPWITELSDILVDNKQDNRGQALDPEQIVSQQVVSDLIEVLIGLMNDVKSGIDELQKNEIQRISENLSFAFKS
eukprot:403377213